MTRFIKIYVINDEGRALQGQRVKTYGSAEQRTDRNGSATVTVDGSQIDLYINGFSAFRGAVTRLGGSAAFGTSGQML